MSDKTGKDWPPAPIRDVLLTEFPGEWGGDPDGVGAPAWVLRSTNLDDDGHVDYRTAANRRIPFVKLQAKCLQPGDILLEASGGGPGKPVGRVGLFDPPDDQTYICSNFFRTLRPSNAVLPRFLWWRLQAVYQNPTIWSFQQQTTGIINLKTAEYLAQVIELPPLTEQHRIAEILDTLDSAIQQTETLIAKLKQIKAGLLHDLLTRGLDEHGQLRDPVAHPDQFCETPLGMFPSIWQVAPLGSVLVTIDAGKSPDCPDRPAAAGEWGVLKVSAVRQEGLQERENKVVLQKTYQNPSLVVRDRDLLTSRANTSELVGLTCFVKDPPDRLLLSDKTLRLIVDSRKAVVEFVAFAMQMPYVRSQIEIHATGTSQGMKNISQGAIRSLRVPIPALTEQRLIVAILAEQDARIQTEGAYLNKLQLLKKGLMDDLLTGRVRVTEP